MCLLDSISCVNISLASVFEAEGVELVFASLDSIREPAAVSG